jgi:allantoate deiminase
MDIDATARAIMERCELLGSYSEESGRLTRRFASGAMRQVNETVKTWMHAAGMNVEEDNVGNLVGRYEADQSGAKTFLLGSHLDTVRDAGKYDGPLGVMIALACIERLHARRLHLPFAIEVLAFADEEGLRYNQAYLGSKFMTGALDPNVLNLTDDEGISMAEAIRSFGGNPDPSGFSIARWRSEELLGYCEVHIEQGPVLEARNLAVGVVSAISGQNRFNVSFIGEAGHAGTVPMSLRRDALSAAAKFILSVETMALSIPGLVATVGQLSVQPGATNVIPGKVTLSLDVRHQEDEILAFACNQLQETAREICNKRKIALDWQLLQAHMTIPCAQDLTGVLEQAIVGLNYPLLTLPSGAGHDGVIISQLTDIAMLFVRCRGGISHNPAEAVAIEDVDVALQVLEQFILLLSARLT